MEHFYAPMLTPALHFELIRIGYTAQMLKAGQMVTPLTRSIESGAAKRSRYSVQTERCVLISHERRAHQRSVPSSAMRLISSPPGSIEIHRGEPGSSA